MSLTLLVENNPKIESFYTLNLITWLGLKISASKSIVDAVKVLNQKDHGVKLIIVRSVIQKEEAGKALIEYLKKKGEKIPVIIVGAGKGHEEAFAVVANSLQLKPLIQAAARALGITAKDMSGKVVPNFYPIPIEYFKHLKRSVCTVYSKDPTAPNNHIMKFDKLQDFKSGVIDQLIDEGVKELYVDKLYRLEFVNNVTAELIVALEANELSEDEAVSATEKGVQLLSKKLLTIGVTEETINLANRNLEVIKKNVKSNPQLSRLLERLLNNQAGYLFKHTQILTYVSLHIIRNIDWGNAEQEEKIAFISFFHDIVLENDIQAQIRSNQELRRSDLSPQDKQLVERHAQMAAEFVSKFPHAPMGSDQIIRQHHGQLNGVGFSEHFGANVSPVSVVFIVAEEFAKIILKRETGPFNRKDMIQELKETFPTSRFQKIISMLETITF